MNANNIPSNCNKQHCHNDDTYTNNINLYLCNTAPPDNQCLSLLAQLLSCSSVDQRLQLMKMPKCSINETVSAMEKYDKHSFESFHRVWHIQCTILVTIISVTFASAVICCGVNDGKKTPFKIWSRYVLEFIVILPPIITSVNVANPYVELIVIISFSILIFVMWLTKCWRLVAKRDYEFGRTPILFTVMRSSVNIFTGVCILAIDFKSFPKEFRKSRRYGVGLMDVGIGIFVFCMGLVATTPRSFSDLRKLAFTVGCLLALGLARTLVIAAVDYHQDEHEYGKHLNAFFTLGLTKLFSTCFGFLTKSNNQLFTLGVVILFSHEAVLQCGVWKYVMDPDIKRSNFISSNREGLCSIPGFISLHLLSQCLGKWLLEKNILNFEEMKNKFKILFLLSTILWLLVTLAIFVIGIARVTCNLGYVLWILAIAVTICAICLLVFNIVLDTLTSVYSERKTVNLSEMGIMPKSVFRFDSKIPMLVEAVNFNGLTFFLLANILTGCTNIFFATDEKTDLESIFILFIYMLITTTCIFLLYRFKLRIA